MQGIFLGVSTLFNRKVSNCAISKYIFYWKAWASLLSIIMRNHEYVHNNGGKSKWQNVQNAELKTPSQRRLGKWQEDQTKPANACN
jgi:hypothetical protein